MCQIVDIVFTKETQQIIDDLYIQAYNIWGGNYDDVIVNHPSIRRELRQNFAHQNAELLIVENKKKNS